MLNCNCGLRRLETPSLDAREENDKDVIFYKGDTNGYVKQYIISIESKDERIYPNLFWTRDIEIEHSVVSDANIPNQEISSLHLDERMKRYQSELDEINYTKELRMSDLAILNDQAQKKNHSISFAINAIVQCTYSKED